LVTETLGFGAVCVVVGVATTNVDFPVIGPTPTPAAPPVVFAIPTVVDAATTVLDFGAAFVVIGATVTFVLAPTDGGTEIVILFFLLYIYLTVTVIPGPYLSWCFEMWMHAQRGI
jgi:hypothetical protein